MKNESNVEHRLHLLAYVYEYNWAKIGPNIWWQRFLKSLRRFFGVFTIEKLHMLLHGGLISGARYDMSVAQHVCACGQ